MFVGCRKGRLVPTMEAARSDQTRRVSRAAAHLVVGVDDTIASTVFGTITAMATIAAYGRAFPDSPWTVEELVASTAVVLWIAHLYTHALSESISERRSLRFSRLRTLARRELGILLAAVPPSIALTLGAVGLFDETASIWLALVVGLVTLALEGTRYARIERLGRTGTLVAVGANVGLGILVVVLKVSVLH
jgi:FtsH-binding integral membrane protein